MATQEQFNELQAVLQQQQRQVEELQAQLNAQNDAGRGLENQLAEEQRQRVQATNELTRATTALAEAQRGLREEREKAAAALSPGEQKLLTKPDRFSSEKEGMEQGVRLLSGGWQPPGARGHRTSCFEAPRRALLERRTRPPRLHRGR